MCDSPDCAFFLAYAHSIVAMQDAGVSAATLLCWLRIDARLACFPEIARLYLRQARQALAEYDRHNEEIRTLWQECASEETKVNALLYKQEGDERMADGE